MRLPVLVACSCLLAACGGGNNAPKANVAPVPPAVVVPADGAVSAAALAEIDDYVQGQISQQHLPGLSLVIARDGKPVLAKGYGLADMAANSAVTPGTVFPIGSVTKQFTASAIMMLVQEGLIKLDDPITQYFPTAPAAWTDITVRRLLNHTSGLPRDFPVEILEKIAAQRGGTPDQVVQLAGTVPLANPTGSAELYSNLGYHLLGLLVEKTSGLYFADFLRQRVLVPLGMTSADVISTTKANPARATGYTRDGNTLQTASTWFSQPGMVEGEGALQMSALDLAKWDAALLGERYLSKASLAEMWTPARLNDGRTAEYGFGWVLDSINHHPFTWHDGRISGFTSQFVRHTNEGLSVIVLANLDGASLAKIGTRVSAIMNPALDWVVAADPQPDRGTLLRGLVDDAKRGAFKADDRFDPSLRAALTAEQVQGINDYFAPWGSITAFGYVDQVTIDRTQVARYLVRTQRDQALIGITTDATGHVTYLTLLSE